ncbi:Uncharacterized protein dnm_014880 [Desulfonema magnum]|uniref:Uncharacterized protein n=1 Tax=Desulfonema magnum TaxID=45655 RepID=A0A975BH92_9BACT|nr:Uncharacterized protein dnm_014880 [Desulfonema magnum]
MPDLLNTLKIGVFFGITRKKILANYVSDVYIKGTYDFMG